MLDGCTLSNSLLVGVHHISKERLLIELASRSMVIPSIGIALATRSASCLLHGAGAVGAHVAKYMNVAGRGQQLFRGTVSGFKQGRNGGLYSIRYEGCQGESLNTTEFQTSYNLAEAADELENAYVLSLRDILVRRLKEEEEYERWTMYARDDRFVLDRGRPKWELTRIIVCMLHCLMRLHEKVLFLLYFAAMKRCVGDAGTQTETLDRMTAKVISIGNITRKWKHNLDKDKQGNDKLLPFKMNYDVSKKLFSFTSLGGLYELIDIAIVSRTDNANWRAFIVSYLNCMRLLILSRDYTPPEVEELDKCCKNMYHLLVTTIGGLEAVTNYFHLIGSGHVVWMVRRYGNLWRYRGEGLEAFNSIVSLRYNKHNKKGGCKKTRKGAPIVKCAEFWSLGQWLGRWTLWHLGYADNMNLAPDAWWNDDLTDDAVVSDAGTDASFHVSNCSDSESSDLDTCEECSDSEVVSVSGGDDTSGAEDGETHWNGVWYSSSDDYEDSDDNDYNCTSDDDSEAVTDDSNMVGLPEDCTHGTPEPMSTPISQVRSVTRRSCNGRAKISVCAQPANVVRAVS